ncbi:MAG: relaxase domain-containing protein [Pseudanabaena sp. CRU_2_10]|nr:relaxase domain-containing protein [Pseudanabaena sp. CRU_2_10]
MNSIGIVHAGRESYYEKLGREDYYTGAHDPKGTFYGEAAVAFGIAGEKIGAEDVRLKNLFNGLSPDGSTALRQGGNQIRTTTNAKTGQQKTLRPVVAYDNVFSAPKDVSILWSQAAPELRTKLHQLHREAVLKAVQYLDTTTYSRSGKGGKESVSAKAVFAVFDHTTSRELDPQLHSHVLIVNAGLKANGRGGALDGKRILDERYPSGMVYQNHLRHGIEQLGISTFDRPFDDGKGITFGIVGISPEVRSAFSQRSLQIESRINAAMTGAQVRAEVLKTRKAKDLTVDSSQLFSGWERRGQELGFSIAAVIPSSRTVSEKENPFQKESYFKAFSTQVYEQQTKAKSVTVNQVRVVALAQAKGKLDTEQVNEVFAQYAAKYLERTNQNSNRKVTFRLNKEGEQQVQHQSLAAKAANFGNAVWQWHRSMKQKGTAAKMAFLYATGRITRRDYLLCKEHQKVARLRLENRIDCATYTRYLETLRREKGIAANKFLIHAQEAIGAVSHSQGRYWSQQLERFAELQPTPLSKAERQQLNKLTPSYIDPPWLSATRQNEERKQQSNERDRGRERER